MTQNEFIIACNAYNIDPAIALESDQVLEAIESGNLDALYTVLENEC